MSEAADDVPPAAEGPAEEVDGEMEEEEEKLNRRLILHGEPLHRPCVAHPSLKTTSPITWFWALKNWCEKVPRPRPRHAHTIHVIVASRQTPGGIGTESGVSWSVDYH